MRVESLGELVTPVGCQQSHRGRLEPLDANPQAVGQHTAHPEGIGRTFCDVNALAHDVDSSSLCFPTSFPGPQPVFLELLAEW